MTNVTCIVLMIQAVSILIENLERRGTLEHIGFELDSDSESLSDEQRSVQKSPKPLADILITEASSPNFVINADDDKDTSIQSADENLIEELKQRVQQRDAHLKAMQTQIETAIMEKTHLQEAITNLSEYNNHLKLENTKLGVQVTSARQSKINLIIQLSNEIDRLRGELWPQMLQTQRPQTVS